MDCPMTKSRLPIKRCISWVAGGVDHWPFTFMVLKTHTPYIVILKFQLDHHIKRLDENLAMFALPTPQPESIPGTPEISHMSLIHPDPIMSLLNMTGTPPPNFPARPMTPLPPSLLSITASTTAAPSTSNSIPTSPMSSRPDSPGPVYGGMVGAFFTPASASKRRCSQRVLFSLSLCLLIHLSL